MSITAAVGSVCTADFKKKKKKMKLSFWMFSCSHSLLTWSSLHSFWPLIIRKPRQSSVAGEVKVLGAMQIEPFWVFTVAHLFEMHVN